MPPYTTHRLQPLDIGIFRLLTTYYSVILDELIANGQGFTYIIKRIFFSIYKKAFDKTFIEEVIKYAFIKPGIWLVFPNDILQTVNKLNSKLKLYTEIFKTFINIL